MAYNFFRTIRGDRLSEVPRGLSLGGPSTFAPAGE
jgi:hypothetical protein